MSKNKIIEFVKENLKAVASVFSELSRSVDGQDRRLQYIEKEQEKDFRDITVLQSKIGMILDELGLEFYKVSVLTDGGDEEVTEEGIRKVSKK